MELPGHTPGSQSPQLEELSPMVFRIVSEAGCVTVPESSSGLTISNVDVPSLIEEVRQRPVLWNKPRSRNRRSADVAQKAWQEISDKLGFPVDVLRLKWNYLLETFRSELIKYGSRWHGLRSMSFLIGFVAPKRSRTRERDPLAIDDDSEVELDLNKFRSVPNEFGSLVPASPQLEPTAKRFRDPLAIDDEDAQANLDLNKFRLVPNEFGSSPASAPTQLVPIAKRFRARDPLAIDDDAEAERDPNKFRLLPNEFGSSVPAPAPTQLEPTANRCRLRQLDAGLFGASATGAPPPGADHCPQADSTVTIESSDDSNDPGSAITKSGACFNLEDGNGETVTVVFDDLCQLKAEQPTTSVAMDPIDLTDDRDEDEDFFQSLLPHAKKIPPHLKLRFRNAMQNIVHEFAYLIPSRKNSQ